MAGSVEPLVVEDMVADRDCAVMPSTIDLGARAYVGVPVVLADGSLYGTLCGLDPAPQGFSDEQVALMQLLARLMASQLDDQRALQEKDEFLASVSHDLKNPLTAIKGTAQLLRRRVADGELADHERLAAGFAALDAAVAQMIAQIDQLVDVGRPRPGGSLDLAHRPVDLLPLMRRAIATQQQATEVHTFTCNAPLQSLVVVGDESRLERALANVLSNAVKYSPQGGPIDVELVRDGCTAIVRVQDSGIGIPVADLPRVFDRYYRGPNAAGKFPGTGIGLADVRQVIEQHNGSVAIQSVLDHGTTVAVHLPLDQQTPCGRRT